MAEPCFAVGWRFLSSTATQGRAPQVLPQQGTSALQAASRGLPALQGARVDPGTQQATLLRAEALSTLMCAAACRRIWQLPRRYVLTRRAGGTSASELEREAAKLREEAEAMQRDVLAEKRRGRASLLLRGAASLRARELQERLKEVEEIDLSDLEVEKLLASTAAEGSAVALSAEELASVRFEDSLTRVLADKAEERRALQAAESERLAKEAEERRQQQEMSSVFSAGSEGDDRSLPLRLLAVLAYLLPLSDGIEYSMPLLDVFPGLVPVIEALAPLAMLKNAIPFGTLIFLILFQSLARNQEYPKLLRFNLAQAAVLDVLLIIPQFIVSLLAFELPEDLLVALFVIILGVVTYSFTLTLLGKEPDGLGGLSDMTKRNLGQW